MGRQFNVRSMHALLLSTPLALGGGCLAPKVLGGVDTDTGTDGSGSSGSEASDGHSSSPTGGDDSSSGGSVGAAPAVDILFVFDNSGSMGEEQGALASSIDALVEQLEQFTDISYRIGVTTTDNGNPWCNGTSPEAGNLRMSSCRERLGDFVFNGVEPSDATAVACTDICTLDEIPLVPTVTEFDPSPRARPWIERGVEGTNLDGVTLSDALHCALPQGIAGCGFESPLESAYKAMLRMQSADESSYGFLRTEAHLVVIFVTDETDCSAQDDTLFLPASMGGNPDGFWSDPTASAPSSAVCWNAGVACTGDGAPYEECHAADYDHDAAVTGNESEAMLRPTSRYTDYFLALDEAKRAHNGTAVFLFGVMGVPVGYPANPLVYADAESPTYQGDFGIGPGCSSEWGNAVPPVREREVIEALQKPGMTTSMFSICEPPLAGVYPNLVAQLAPFLGA